MISMFINFGAIPPNTDPLFGTAKQQQTVSLAMLVLCVICVPTLLCCKPIILYLGQRQHHARVAKLGSFADEFEGVQMLERAPSNPLA